MVVAFDEFIWRLSAFEKRQREHALRPMRATVSSSAANEAPPEKLWLHMMRVQIRPFRVHLQEPMLPFYPFYPLPDMIAP